MSMDFVQQAVDTLNDHGLPYALVAAPVEGSMSTAFAYQLYETWGADNKDKIVDALRVLASRIEEGEWEEGIRVDNKL
jgi:hypothetical protein